MKTITLTAADERLIRTALQQYKNKLTREGKYDGVKDRQRRSMRNQAIQAKRLEHKIINSK